MCGSQRTTPGKNFDRKEPCDHFSPGRVRRPGQADPRRASSTGAEAAGRHDSRPSAARWLRPGAVLPVPTCSRRPKASLPLHKRGHDCEHVCAARLGCALCRSPRDSFSGGASSRPSFCNQNQVRRGPGAHGARCCGGKSGVNACTTLTLPIPSIRQKWDRDRTGPPPTGC